MKKLIFEYVWICLIANELTGPLVIATHSKKKSLLVTSTSEVVVVVANDGISRMFWKLDGCIV